MKSALSITLVGLAALCGWLAAPTPAAAEPFQISDGTLTWGVKASWRAYAGPATLSDGVVQDEQGLFQFPVESGSYDPETGTTTIQARGTVHWQSHWYPDESHLLPPPVGYTGPLDIYVLDITLKDPALTIGADGSVLTVEAVSRDVGTWELVDLSRTEFVELDPTVATVDVAGGTTSWEGIFAALTESGANQVFGRNYQPGQAVDTVAFSYAGEGGAPDFSEHWSAPDSTGLELAVNGVWGETGQQVIPRWVDNSRGVLHDTFNAPGTGQVFRAFDLTTGEMLGEPYKPTTSPALMLNGEAFLDTGRNELYFSSAMNTTIDSVLRWDAGTKTYDEEPIGPFTVVANRLLWDGPRDRAIGVKRVVPEGAGATDYEAHEWYVFTYTRQEDGSFVEGSYRLPDAPAGWNQAWYNAGVTRAAVAADGSILLPRPASMPTQEGVTPAPVTEVGVQRIELDEEAGTATVSEVPGSGSAPGYEEAYDRVYAGPSGHVAVVRLGSFASPTRILQFELDENGALVGAGPAVHLLQQMNATLGFSPVDGTVWHLDKSGQRLNGVRDGHLVYSRPHTIINTRVNTTLTIDTLSDGDVWFVSSNGTPATFLSSSYGYARFEVSGYSPVVTDQPEGATVTVAPGGNTPVTLAATATGTPAPSVRWQRRAPGSARFVDIAGETAETLELDASGADNGAAYRAVFGNVAGELATEPAALTVRYAPTVSFDPADRGAVEGEDATFTLLAVGSPEPAFTWQRRVNGFWEAVDPESGDFEVDGNELIVRSVNLAMDGALFRARVGNGVGVAYSRAARLTVKSAVGEPVTFGTGSFEWGFANRWRCYVVGTVAKGGIELAGGVTRVPGTTASGGLCPGAGAGSEALRFPVRGGSYDPASGELEVRMNGSVRFWGHAHHAAGSAPVLDTLFTNLRLVAEGETGTLYADAVGATLENPTPVTRKGIALVSVDLAETGPDPTADGLAWAAAPTALTASGTDAFGSYPEGEPFDPISMALAFGEPQPDPEPGTEPLPELPVKPVGPVAPSPQPQPAAAPVPPAKATIGVNGGNPVLGTARTARLATLSCPAGLPGCEVTAPRRITVKIAGKSYRARVLVPKRIAAGDSAGLRIRLPKGALASLGDGSVTVAVAVTIAAGEETVQRTLRVRLRGDS